MKIFSAILVFILAVIGSYCWYIGNETIAIFVLILWVGGIFVNQHFRE